MANFFKLKLLFRWKIWIFNKQFTFFSLKKCNIPFLGIEFRDKCSENYPPECSIFQNENPCFRYNHFYRRNLVKWKKKYIHKNWYKYKLVIGILNIYRLSSFNFPPLFPAEIARKRCEKLSEERRYNKNWIRPEYARFTLLYVK